MVDHALLPCVDRAMPDHRQPMPVPCIITIVDVPETWSASVSWQLPFHSAGGLQWTMKGNVKDPLTPDDL